MQFLFLLAMLAATPDNTQPSENAAVARPVVNMYSRATNDADVVSQAIFSSNITILQQDGSWLKIRTPDDYTGWIQSADVIRRAPYAQSGKIARVEALFANLYRETDITKHEPLLTIPFESRLEVLNDALDAEGRWVEVRLPDGRSAWVQSGDVTLDKDPKITMAEMIEFSKRFIGLPYLWGGTSTFGYDCSGFIQMLYRRMGYSLPRDAGPQAHWNGLKPVDKSELQPGDLLYFGSSPEKITHTGMYIGNGEFINASSHIRPIVQVTSLSDPYRAKQFVAARRLK